METAQAAAHATGRATRLRMYAARQSRNATDGNSSADVVVSTAFASPDCNSVGCEKMRAAMFVQKA